MCVDSLLNRCYLLVSGSVRVRRGVMSRWGLGLGLGLALGLQLGIGIGFRCNHSWSTLYLRLLYLLFIYFLFIYLLYLLVYSIFTPRRNHSLCLSLYIMSRVRLCHCYCYYANTSVSITLKTASSERVESGYRRKHSWSSIFTPSY